jgi:iron(III) transport system substrate-binding protein
MRRYLPLLVISFFIVAVVLAGTFLASYAGHKDPAAVRSIVLYTTLPVEQAVLLAQEYEKTAGVRVNVVPLTAADLLIKAGLEAGSPKADVFLAAADTLEQAKKDKLLQPFASEQTDIVPVRFCEAEDYWIGVWYDPIVFAANKDYLKKLPEIPASWAALADTPDYRLVMTDFLAAEASANLLYSLASVGGEEQTLAYLARLHPRIVQYAKFLATPVRMVGLGEADIAVAVQSETLRYVREGFPVQEILPAEGTAIYLTGAALSVRAPHADDARKFIDWLLQDQAQQLLFNNKYYFVPTNPESKMAKAYDIKNLNLFDYNTGLTPQQKAKLLDKWVQTVRLASR